MSALPARARMLLGVAALLGLLGFLAWSTMAAQQAECEVCVTYRGRRNCAGASAASVPEAQESAQATACGILATGMNEGVACGRARPDVVRCRNR